MEYAIKFRPVRSASPHLNGKSGAVSTHGPQGVLHNGGLEGAGCRCAFASGRIITTITAHTAHWAAVRLGGLVGKGKIDSSL
jgi:hypothetical protein